MLATSRKAINRRRRAAGLTGAPRDASHDTKVSRPRLEACQWVSRLGRMGRVGDLWRRTGGEGLGVEAEGLYLLLGDDGLRPLTAHSLVGLGQAVAHPH